MALRDLECRDSRSRRRTPVRLRKRLYKRNASGGVVTAGFSVGDPPVHVRSASLGDPISAGSARYYFVYYRDPVVLGGCPAASTFNCTQAGSLIWYP